MRTKFARLTLGAFFVLAIALVPPLRAQFAYVANASGNNVSAYSIGADGALTPVPGSPFAAGFGPYSVAVDPTAKFAYVANQLAPPILPRDPANNQYPGCTASTTSQPTASVPTGL